MFTRPLKNDATTDRSKEGNEPHDDNIRKSEAYHGSTPGFVVRLESGGEDLVPKYDTNGRMFVVDPKDGERTYIIWS
jgi:hypothetical protein